MIRSFFRVSLRSGLLVGASALALFTACNGDSSEQPSDPQASSSAGAPAGGGGEPACVPEPPALPGDVPADIAMADGTTLIRSLHAVGTQNYRCTETAGDVEADPSFTWVFVGPVADLLNSCGIKVGSHFAVPDSNPPAPEWKYEVDGSSVIGAKVAASPVEGSIPELLLKQDGHDGAGVFAGVTFVQRLQTAGGAAPPAAECTSEHVDEVVEVAYSAQYYFYSGGD